MSEDGHLAHIVFFDLNDDTEANRATLIASAKEHLSGHDGTVYFSVGALVPDLDRPVNDHDFSVALHVVFENRAAHDVYQTHERHLKYIETNKASWKRVRVFDSYL
jgi:hypothetical protein